MSDVTKPSRWYHESRERAMEVADRIEHADYRVRAVCEDDEGWYVLVRGRSNDEREPEPRWEASE